ncbi:MAG TPA: hypothetical protein VES67_07025 [Vicinamibacterales bacterium]|nr:hypothetical protein [Vicinamibacterales bacterium]
MRRQLLVFVAATVSLTTALLAGAQQTQPLGFFITSVGSGDGANLGGLAGADKHCQTLAEAAGSRGRTWRAYLSAAEAGSQPAVNARDRIGSGPWHNAKGVAVAQSVADLHSDKNQLSKENSITEKGAVVNGRGDTPNTHDILTGAQLDGTLTPGTTDTTCKNWMSNGEGSATVGHHDRQGGGTNPTSWNSAHASKGCSQENLRGSGGAGLFYCFAAK